MNILKTTLLLSVFVATGSVVGMNKEREAIKNLCRSGDVVGMLRFCDEHPDTVTHCGFRTNFFEHPLTIPINSSGLSDAEKATVVRAMVVAADKVRPDLNYVNMAYGVKLAPLEVALVAGKDEVARALVECGADMERVERSEFVSSASFAKLKKDKARKAMPLVAAWYKKKKMEKQPGKTTLGHLPVELAHKIADEVTLGMFSRCDTEYNTERGLVAPREESIDL